MARLDARVFVYRINKSDVITYVNDAWLEFARENDAYQLVVPGVLGKCLWDSVTGADIRQIYELILHKVRNRYAQMRLHYRCDGPTVRRFMELVIRPAGNEVELSSRILREEQRPPVLLLDPRVPRSKRSIVMCTLCKKVATPEWLEIEDAIGKLKLFHSAPLPRLRHGVCKYCVSELRLIEARK